MKSYLILLAVLGMFLGACSQHPDGSPENPVRLPDSELRKFADISGRPMKVGDGTPMFGFMFDNQTDWSLVAAKISIKKNSTHERREYIGKPLLLTGVADNIGPKSPGVFVFQIGTFLSYEERPKGASKWEKEPVFEPHEWKIESVIGYK